MLSTWSKLILFRAWKLETTSDSLTQKNWRNLMAGKTWENPVHKLWLCDPKSLDALPHITPYLMDFPGFSPATLPITAIICCFQSKLCHVGYPMSSSIAPQECHRAMNGCTVPARLLHGCCVAMLSGTQSPATEAGTVAVWHWTKSGARWGGWRETKKKPKGDGTSRIWRTDR